MSITFFLTPYLPKESTGNNDCFRLDPEDYKAKLIEKWGDIEFYPLDSEYIALFWSMPRYGEYVGCMMELLDNCQSVTFGYDSRNAAFIHWHRGLVDAECTLYFYNSSSFKPIEITPTMSLEEIRAISGP